MAAKPPPALPRRHAQLMPEQILPAIDSLRARQMEILASEPPEKPDRNVLVNLVGRLTAKAQATFRDVFGEGSAEEGSAHWFGYVFPIPDADRYGRFDWNACLRAFEKGKGDLASEFQTQIELLVEKAEAMPGAVNRGRTPPDKLPSSAVNDDIFIVHGQVVTAKAELQLFLTRAGLRPVVLHEEANAGRTIIEKFEDHAGAVGFAVALLTPDDEGGPKGGPMNPRARQNVVGELFWFAGKLGRKRVCALRKGNVEIPSDFAGLVYTEMDDRGSWKQQLLRELRNAGYTVDANKALGL